MKTKLLLLLLLGLTTSIFCQWQMIDSSNTNVINDFVSNGKYLFVGGGKFTDPTGILKRSSDGGATWSIITNGIANSPITQITGSGEEFYLQSSNPQAVGSGFVFRSIDGGINWTKVSIGIASYPTVELLFDGTTLLALFNNQFYTSTDNGKTWTSKSKITSSAAMQGLVKNGTVYYTYSAALNGYYYSEDNCSTWKLSSTPNVMIKNISTDEKNLYIVANDNTQSTYLSTDQGKTFVTGTRITGVYDISNMTGIGNAVFIAGRLLTNYVYLSTDKLQTWKNISDGIPLTDFVFNKILIKGDYVYLGLNYISIAKPGYQIWRRKLSDFGIATAVQDNKEVPTKFKLMQNYPNPFNPSTTISYNIQVAGKVTLKVFDLLGREVATLVDEVKQPGVYRSNFSVSQNFLSSGIYFYTLKANEYSETKKMILTK